MPKSAIPQWALCWKRKGTVLQMVGDLCCIYRTRSFRVRGQKNPSVERKYIGVVTPDGVVVKTDVNIDKGDVEVWEAGFTDFILNNTPHDLVEDRNFESEKERLAFQDRLVTSIILRRSGKSYIGRTREADESIKPNLRTRYELRFQELLGVRFEELECLKQVYLLVFQGGLEARSRMNREQMDVYARHSIPFPWERKNITSSVRPQN